MCDRGHIQSLYSAGKMCAPCSRMAFCNLLEPGLVPGSFIFPIGIMQRPMLPGGRDKTPPHPLLREIGLFAIARCSVAGFEIMFELGIGRP